MWPAARMRGNLRFAKRPLLDIRLVRRGVCNRQWRLGLVRRSRLSDRLIFGRAFWWLLEERKEQLKDQSLRVA